MKKFGMTSMVAMGAALAAQPALAQDDGSASATEAASEDEGGFAEIVVVARRSEENLQDVPIAVSAIGGDELAAQGILSTSDLAAQVPNLQVSSPFGKTQPNFILRGISVANEFNANQASPNGVYLDEVYVSARFAQGINLFDIERLEVVKGPQGTLYGRNTVGGAINIITRKAEFDILNGYVEAGYGNFNRYNVTAAVGGTLVDDVLAFRIAGQYEKGDGQLPNNVAGTNDGDSVNTAQPDGRSVDNYALRGSLLVKPSDAVSFTLRGYIGETDGTSEAPFSIGTTPQLSPAGVPVGGYNRELAGLDFFETDANHVGRNAASAEGVALLSNFQFGEWELVSVTSYDSGDLSVDQDPDGSPLDNFRILWSAEYEQFNQDIRLVSDQTAPLRGLIGAYYGWDEVRTFNRYGFYRNIPFQVINSAVGPAPGGADVDHRFTQTRESYAVYGELNWDITDNLTLTGGLRYTWDDIELSDISSQVFTADNSFHPRSFVGTLIPANPLGLVIPGVPFPLDFDPNATCPTAPGCPPVADDSSELTGRVILSYTPEEDILLYASYSTGYRGSAINGTAYISPAQLTFVEPETVKAYEVGLKSTFDKTVRLNSAFFYYDYSNQQLQQVIGVVPFLRNAPEARAWGIDADLSVIVSDAVQINLGFGYLDSEYQELTLIQDLIPRDLAGNNFSNAPDMTFNVDVDLTLIDDGEQELRFRPSANFTGDTFFSPFNDVAGNANLGQEGYWTANIQAEYERGPLAVSAYVRNLFEKEYFTYGIDLRAAFGLDFLVRGERRTYGMNVRYSF